MDWKARAREIAIEEQVNPDLFLKLVGAESNFNPSARSGKGAVGLGQLMPATAAGLGVDPTDPEQNLRGSARYLRQMHEKFQSTPLAVAAYNAGPGRVARAGGIPRIAETEAYVKKVAGDPSLQSGADIFADDGPAVAPATAAAPASPAAQPSIRRGADGTIEIDINEGHGGNSGADIFEDAPEPSAPLAAAAPSAAPPEQKDQILGYAAGVNKPLDNLAGAILKIPGAKQLDEALAHTFGMPTTEQAIADHKTALADYERRGIKPGGLGKFVGEMLGTAPTVMLPGGVLVQGGATGALLTDKTDAKGVAGDVATGAIAGKVADVGLNALGKALAPTVRPLVQRLQEAGVSITPGQALGKGAQRLEDKLQSLPFAGSAITSARERGVESFNRAAINRTLSPIGKALPEDVAAGHDAVKYADEALSDAYDELLPGLTVHPDEELATAIKSLAPMVQQLPAARQKQLRGVIDQTVKKLGADGQPISGEAFKQVETDLGKFIRQYGGTKDGDQEVMAEIARQVQGELRDMLERQNPEAAKQLRSINTGFANLVRVSDAASKTGAEEGVFSPAALLQSVRAADKSGRKKASAKGEALLQDLASAGKSVLTGKVGNSGTADRLMQGNLVSQVVGALTGIPVAAAYSEAGQKAVVPLLTKRSPLARRLGELLPHLKAPAVSAGATAAVNARN